MTKKIRSISSSLVLAILILAVIFFAVPKIFGVKMYNISSESMTPKYKVGDLIYAVPTQKENIKAGDVISFVMNENLTVATHRIVRIDDQQHFITKGDANAVEDGKPVLYDNVLGVVKYRIPMVGDTLQFLSTAEGKIIAAGILGIIVLGMVLLSVFERRKEKLAYETSSNTSDDPEINN